MGRRGNLDSRLAQLPFDSQRSWTESMLKAEANGEDTRSNARSHPETASMLVSMARKLHQLELDSVARENALHGQLRRLRWVARACAVLAALAIVYTAGSFLLHHLARPSLGL